MWCLKRHNLNHLLCWLYFNRHYWKMIILMCGEKLKSHTATGTTHASSSTTLTTSELSTTATSSGYYQPSPVILLFMYTSPFYIRKRFSCNAKNIFYCTIQWNKASTLRSTLFGYILFLISNDFSLKCHHYNIWHTSVRPFHVTLRLNG